MLKLTVNGIEIEAQDGEMILSALTRQGIEVPTLCAVKGLAPSGACRVCVVEIEGFANLVPACSYPVAQGMKIETHSPKAVTARRTIVELLLANHPDDCLYCAKSAECELRKLAENLGIHQRLYSNTSIARKPDYSSPAIFRDPAKCILCGRCVAVCGSVVVNEVLEFGGRGSKSRIICDADTPMGLSSCVMCGACVQACPVGALTEKKSMGKGRSEKTQNVRTTCPYCGVGCQLDVLVAGEEIIRVNGVVDANPNRGNLCVKGRFGYDFIYSDERLTSPLIRENGEFRKASWDEALDLVAREFKRIASSSGPDAIGGVACARSTNEDSYSMQKLFRSVLKTNNIDHCART